MSLRSICDKRCLVLLQINSTSIDYFSVFIKVEIEFDYKSKCDLCFSSEIDFSVVCSTQETLRLQTCKSSIRDLKLMPVLQKLLLLFKMALIFTIRHFNKRKIV